MKAIDITASRATTLPVDVKKALAARFARLGIGIKSFQLRERAEASAAASPDVQDLLATFQREWGGEFTLDGIYNLRTIVVLIPAPDCAEEDLEAAAAEFGDLTGGAVLDAVPSEIAVQLEGKG